MKTVFFLIAVALLCFEGCSKKKCAANPKTGDDEPNAFDSLPELSKAKPAEAGVQGNLQTTSIIRQSDGLWHEAGSGKIFYGTVVYEQDEMRFEEKFNNGVRISVRAWDKEANPVELHAWNEDGSPRY